MQTILGAGGVIGVELAKALTNYTQEIKLVSRNPRKVNQNDILFIADLTNPENVKEAVKGSEVAYLTAGLPYDIRVWRKDWPLIMRNVIDACLENGCRLVFFDNIYLYSGEQLNPITETTPVDPPSKKGKVRAEIADMLRDAVRNKGLIALIARSADFYGPSLKNNVSALIETVFKPLSEGKTANLLVSDKYRHSYTYTPDAGKATALLGNTPDAFGETWHLPTAGNPFTGKEWIKAIAEALGTKPKYRVVSKTMVKIIGLLVPVMRESHEMLYQYDKDYVFNSDKFEKKFSFRPTPYEEGIKAIIKSDFKNKQNKPS